MKVRNLSYICQIPESDRFRIISNGLSLLIENIKTILISLEKLESWETIRGYRILRQIAEEEAAKILILIDYIRCPDNKNKEKSRQLKYFYDHFVRLLYTEYCSLRPNSWGEICKWIELMRPELYLDGSIGCEFIFRNDLLQKRERNIYVDYVERDNENIWISPKRYEIDKIEEWKLKSNIVQLVLVMDQCNFFCTTSLKIINNIWGSIMLTENTQWYENEIKNKETINEFIKRGIIKDINKNYISIILDRWSFPLYDLDLKTKKVDIDDLKKIQENWDYS